MQGSWRLLFHSYGVAHSRSLCLSISAIHTTTEYITFAHLFYNYVQHILFCIIMMFCPRSIYTHTQYWAIYRYSPQWHISSICRNVPESASTDSTIVWINFDLILRPQSNGTISLTFRPRPIGRDAVNRFSPYFASSLSSPVSSSSTK